MLSVSPRQTKRIGQNLAKKILKSFKNKTLIIGLEGELGGGKTTFLQGFAEGLKIKKKILSPTFIIIKKFTIPRNKKTKSKFRYFYHIDCYRIKKPKEILDLDFNEIASSPGNIVAIEWSNRIKKIIPRETLWINFKFVDKNKRKIKINTL